MQKPYTKFPLALLTLLNYAPYAHTDNNNIEATANNKSSTVDLSNTEKDIQTKVMDFLNAEPIENFNALLNKHLPADVMKLEDLQELYALLSQLPLGPSIQLSESPFAQEEFNAQKGAIIDIKDNGIVYITTADGQHKASIPVTSIAALGCDKVLKATINPENNVLFMLLKNDQNPNATFISLINTKTLFSLLIPCISETDMKNIDISADSSRLGIMRTDDSILAYDIPADLVSFNPTFKQRAFMSYVNAQFNLLSQKIMNNDANNDIIKMYGRLAIDDVRALASLIENNKDILPESLYKNVYESKVNSLHEIIAIHLNTKRVAHALKIDVDTLADKIAANEVTEKEILDILS
jgi:hypothetical protein